MKRAQTPLLALVQSYFQAHLRGVRGASQHTIRAYRDGLRLFFVFIAEERGRPVSKLNVEDLRSDVVLAFLDHLERVRRNSAGTRNCRLAAVHGFVEHVLRHDPCHAEQYRQVLAMPAKRAQSRPPSYLEPEEARVLLRQPESTTTAGIRDRALLLVLYNTGARVSEALSIRTEDIQLQRPRQVRLHGKGSKDRFCPLWAETAIAIRSLLRCNPPGQGPIFRNARGAALSRDGAAYILGKHARSAARILPVLARRKITPHVLRHSCAVALLQAGVELSVIRDYLGHVSVATTGRYLSTNLQTKRTVLEAFWRRAGLDPKPPRPWQPSPGCDRLPRHTLTRAPLSRSVEGFEPARTSALRANRLTRRSRNQEGCRGSRLQTPGFR
jgi:integrase/recombinase XerD